MANAAETPALSRAIKLLAPVRIDDHEQRTSRAPAMILLWVLAMVGLSAPIPVVAARLSLAHVKPFRPVAWKSWVALRTVSIAAALLGAGFVLLPISSPPLAYLAAIVNAVILAVLVAGVIGCLLLRWLWSRSQSMAVILVLLIMIGVSGFMLLSPGGGGLTPGQLLLYGPIASAWLVLMTIATNYLIEALAEQRGDLNI
jgi:hypothetical protein